MYLNRRVVERQIMSKDPTKEEMLRAQEQLASMMYEAWKDAPLRSVVMMINGALQGDKAPNLVLQVSKKINAVREKAIDMFLSRNASRPEGKKKTLESIRNLDSMKLPPIAKETAEGRYNDWTKQETTEEEMMNWLRHAKGVAMRIEQFHSHANKKNPTPKHVYEDLTGRPNRSAEEEAWLIEEDKYSHMLAVRERNKRRRTNAKGKGKGRRKGKKTGKKEGMVLDAPKASRMTTGRSYAPSSSVALSSRLPPRPRAIPAFPRL